MIVYCVLCDDGGGSFLEKIFKDENEAYSYKMSQGRYNWMYHVEVWDVE